MNEVMNQLRSARILMTGGTGFVGHAMREYFELFDIDATLYITSRKAKQPTQQGRVRVLPGSAATFNCPDNITHIIHLEPDIHARMFALAIEHKCPLLFASSGAARVESDYPDRGYVNAKRVGETMCWWAWQERGLHAKVARLWSFVGPHLPLDSTYAIGNFIRDGLNGGPIVVKGDGKAVRSYLYTTDLAEWMWMILLRGRPGEIYNVGSEDYVSIKSLAEHIAYTMRHCDIIYANTLGDVGTRYVPVTLKTRHELGLEQRVGLDEAIAKTIEWNRNNANRQ